MKKIKIAQIGTSQNSHGADIWKTLIKLPDVFEKYDNYVPYELLRKAYAKDKLRADEAEEQIRKIFEEYK